MFCFSSNINSARIPYMEAKAIELKGHQYTLFSVKLTGDDLQQFTAQLATKMAQAPKLLAHAPVAVMLSDDSAELNPSAIKQAVIDAGFILAGIVGGNQQQKDAARQAGIALLNSGTTASTPPERAEPAEPKPQAEPVATKVVQGPIRSGQQVYAKGGDLVVLGQVSAGAEVIADGSVHIYGTLRGKAIAGVQGQSQARIYCQSLQAELVSISGTYWLNETLQEQGWQQATCISLVDGQLQTSSL